MTTKAYNLMWIRPTFPQKNEEFHCPLPDEVRENILKIAEQNPDTDVRLWIDKKRLTSEQMKWLKKMVEDYQKKRVGKHPNLSLRNLQSIPQYKESHFFNTPDLSSDWRQDDSSLIWRQVDTARLLICLQGDYDQVFYSDADIILNLDSNGIQERLKKYGIVLSGYPDAGIKSGSFALFENRVFGFDRSQHGFFERLYRQTYKDCNVGDSAYSNGYNTLFDFAPEEFKKMGVDPAKVVMDFGGGNRHDYPYPGEHRSPERS